MAEWLNVKKNDVIYMQFDVFNIIQSLVLWYNHEVAIPKKLPELGMQNIKLGSQDTRMKLPCRVTHLLD